MDASARKKLTKPFSASVASTIERAVIVLVFCITGALVVGPIGYLLYGTIRSGAPGSPGAVFTLHNWVSVYFGTGYWRPFLNTLVLALTVSIASVLVGTILAWIIARTNAPGRRHLAVLLVVPMMISSLISALSWIALAAPNAGFMNATARALLGVHTVFDVYTFWGVALVLTLHYASFSFVAMYAAFQSIDSSLEEASYVLGAGPLATALRMTVRLAWPTIAATLLAVFVFVSENFSVPTLLGTPVGFQTLPTRIFIELANSPARPPTAATVGTMLLWIALLGTFLQRRIARNASRYVTVGGKGQRRTAGSVGFWKWIGTAFCVAYLAIAVVLPYLALLLGSFLNFITPRVTLKLLTLSNYSALLSSQSVSAIRNSILLSVVGGLVATLFFVFLTYFLRRARGGIATVLEYMTIIPTATPALVLAVGILWEFVALPGPLYGTVAVLLIAYITRYLGYGVRQSSAGFIQLSRELEEAGRVSGARPLRVFRDITLPLLRPTIVALWTMLFILFFMEISATILLYSPTSVTLPILLWNSMASGYTTQAFAVGVVQAAVIFIVLYVANRTLGVLRTTVEQ